MRESLGAGPGAARLATLARMQQPPGWYHAQGDPPGTQRWWDGELWQGEPVPSPSAGPGRYEPNFYPEPSQATTALVLGILGIVVCWLLGPVAWHYGNEELAGIDAGRRDPTNRGMAQAGRIMGIVATALLGIGLSFAVVLVAGGFALL